MSVLTKTLCLHPQVRHRVQVGKGGDDWELALQALPVMESFSVTWNVRMKKRTVCPLRCGTGCKWGRGVTTGTSWYWSRSLFFW